ncbi:HAD family hydrolase [Oceanibium sediminis]|uniref:HAD family hydrolase n=1 Tax=Oceanibium sediminis TaxID=2026339 RepID=UPI000DD4BE03|nr:HAD family phosphatase [Oceanibium sediminis]
MPRPDAVVFDIGNVLITWDPEREYDARFGEAERKRLFAEVDLHGMNERVDAGANFRDSVFALAENHPEDREMIEAWYHHWLDMASPAIDDSWVLLRRLRKAGVPVFALSNFGIQTYALAQTVYPILHEFDRPYISGHMGVTKPGPDIYRMVEEDSGLTGAQLFFIDDRADNIAAAEARGWQGHVFHAPAALEQALEATGLRF